MSDKNYKRFVRHHKKHGRGFHSQAGERTAEITVRGTVIMRAFKSHELEDTWFVKSAAGAVPARYIESDHILPIRIEPSNPAFNAFALMGIAKNLCWVMRMDGKRIMEDMTSKDYAHLLDVFEDNFGNVVELVRNKTLN